MMCGINGVVLSSPRREVARQPLGADISKMNAAIAHRGPDGCGVYVGEGVGLGHRRLAILDLTEAGAQPMFNADRSLVLVFNGEIYNYLELIPDLRAAGHEFRSRTDSEVVLHAYAEWGDACVQRFNGMWAFAIWDVRRRRLFASRDRFGVKPLVYLERTGEFVFSSEIAGILAVRPVTEANLGKLHDYLAYGYRTNNGETFFAGVRDLPPAHNLVVEDGEVRLSRYWSLPDGEKYGGNEADLIERFLALLRDAVLLRFRSDVPVALLQSGGLDSSAICRVVDDEIEAGKLGIASVAAFTSVYPGERFDESALVRELIAGCRHVYSVGIGPEAATLASTLPDFVKAMGEPVYSTTAFAHWRLMQAIRERGVKVVINGQGSDEAFAGYGRSIVGYRLLDLLLSGPHVAFAEFRAIQKNLSFSTAMMAAQVAKAVLGRRMASKFRSRFVEGASQLLDSTFRREYDGYLMGQAPTLAPRNLDHHLRAQVTHFGFNQILHYEDQSSMSCGIEIRSPFIDYRLMELAFTLPDSYKFAGGMTKRLVRQAFASKLPARIIREKEKIGFATPFDSWMRHPSLQNAVVRLVTSPEFAGRRIWRAPQLRNRLLGQQGTAPRFPAWRFINVELWARAFGIANL
jgi:asparagine synthase (glutamine-hydrolysing)